MILTSLTWAFNWLSVISGIVLSFFYAELVEFRQVFKRHNIILTVTWFFQLQLNMFHSRNTLDSKHNHAIQDFFPNFIFRSNLHLSLLKCRFINKVQSEREMINKKVVKKKQSTLKENENNGTKLNNLYINSVLLSWSSTRLHNDNWSWYMVYTPCMLVLNHSH